MTLKSIRAEKGLTQLQAAALIGVSRRTYITYENNEANLPVKKLKYFYHVLSEYGLIDEDHGVLSLETIKSVCAEICEEYGAEYCYLFGSYARHDAKETSDVDLLISVPVTGIKFFEIIETFRERLKKKVDLIDAAQLNANVDLLREILKDGIKIYG